VTVSAWLSRIIVALVQLVSIRLLLGGLGNELYAVIVILNSFAAWYLLTDLGVGAGLQNYMSEERAKGGNGSNYLVLSGLVSGVLLILFTGLLYLLSPFFSSIFFKSIVTLGSDEKSSIFFASGILSIGLALGNIGYRAWYAQQRGYLSNIMPALASLIGLCLVWIIMGLPMEIQSKLLWSVMALGLPATILALASYCLQIVLIPKFNRRFSRATLNNLIKRSLKFCFLNAMATAVLSVDIIVLSQYSSADQIVVYGITTRIFGFIAFFYTSLYAALWPHFTEAITKSDWASVMGHLRKTLFFSFGIVISSTLLLITFMPSISEILSPNERLDVPISFILLVGVYHLILAWVHGFAIVLQSMSDMRFLVFGSPLQPLVSITFQVIFVQLWGIHGITLGLIISFLLTSVWMCPSRVRHHRKLAAGKAS